MLYPNLLDETNKIDIYKTKKKNGYAFDDNYAKSK